MDQAVDVIKLLKIQVIQDFENQFRELQRGHFNVKMCSILDRIAFIESCGYIKNPQKIGKMLVDLTDRRSIQEYERLVSNS